MFNSSNAFVGADSCAYNRTAMLAGTAAQQAASSKDRALADCCLPIWTA